MPLLKLPHEIQTKILQCLKYPDLVRLQRTCHQLRDFITHHISHHALLQLEIDLWLRKEVHDEDQYFEQRGYKLDDIQALESRIPCYTCLKLHGPDFILNSTASNPGFWKRHYSRSEVPHGRFCLQCCVKEPEYQGESSARGRWIRYVGMLRLPCWIIDCPNCHRAHKTFNQPSRRQRLAELCHGCWQASHPQRLAFKDAVITEIDRLNEYLNWMVDVDRGAGLTARQPPRLAGLQDPDWDEIRTDALTELETFEDTASEVGWPSEETRRWGLLRHGAREEREERIRKR